jgi:hypothetical protein
MCGPHRHRQATEEDDPDAPADNGAGAAAAPTGDSSPQFSVLLSALRAPTPKNLNLLADAGPVIPTVVYTGPTRTQAQMATLAAIPEADPVKKKAKHKPATAKAGSGKKADAQPADGTPATAAATTGTAKDGAAKSLTAKDGKAKDSKAKDGKTTAAVPWTPMSSSALAASPPPDLKADAPTPIPAQKQPVKPKPADFAQ